MTASCQNRTGVGVAVALALLTAAVYWPLLHFEFINYDDQEYVTDNAHVCAGLTWRGVVWAFSTMHAGNWHPLTWLSHMLDCQLFDLNAGAHHLVNLLFHVANTLLLFGVLKRMTQALWRSALVAALFALHPLHVESVAWVAERKDVLSTLFFMLTLWAYARYAQPPAFSLQPSAFKSPASRHLPSSIFYLLALACFALGLMSKPMLVTLPFVLLLLDYWPLKRIEFGSRRSPLDFRLVGRLVWEKLPFFLLSIVLSVITYRAQQSGGAVVPTHVVPVIGRLGNAFVAYCRYLRKTLWPDDLAVFYPHPGTWPLWQVIGAGLFLAAVSVSAAALIRRRPYLFTGWFWFIGTLIPVIGVLQAGMQSIADRYSYLPLVGIFVVLVWLAADFAMATPRGALVLRPIAVTVLLACFGMTRWQLQHWQNSEMLFSHALRVTKNNDVAHNGLGTIRCQQGKPEEAIAHFREAVRLSPGFAEAHNNLGGVLAAQGKLEEALVHLVRTLELNSNYVSAYNTFRPGNAKARYNLAKLLALQGNIGAAVAHYRQGLRECPDNAEVINNLAWLRATHPDARFRDGKEAVELAMRAVELTRTNDAPALDTLAAAYAEAGRFAEAVKAAQRALELAEAAGQKNLSVQIQARLDAYQHQQPYREP